MENIAEFIENSQFYHVFQPICHLHEKNNFGYEALIRSKSGINPDVLFKRAMEQEQLFALDTMSILHALSVFFASPVLQKGKDLLFVNIYPSTIVEAAFPFFIDEIRRRFLPFLNRIVLEINETIIEGQIWNTPFFIQRIRELRDQGFLIALDDVGEGTTTFRKIVEISPDFIKIDRFFSKELSISKKKQKVIHLFVDYCMNESQLILEGIEREDDFVCACLLGVTIGQGYFLGKPDGLKD